jgi:hypothetical protein
VVAVVVLGLAARSAHAQEATPVPAAEAAPAPARPLFAGTHFGFGASFGIDSPVAFLAANSDAFLWGAGLLFAYDGNAMMEKTHASAVLTVAYMVHNRFPFAMGPEIDYAPQLAPNAFDNHDLRAGWTLWYAPWTIPCVIGTAVFADFAFASGKSTVVTSVSPAVRIVFGFH